MVHILTLLFALSSQKLGIHVLSTTWLYTFPPLLLKVLKAYDICLIEVTYFTVLCLILLFKPATFKETNLIIHTFLNFIFIVI